MNGLRKRFLSPHATANFALVLVVLVLNSFILHSNSIALHQGQEVINGSSEAMLQSRALLATFLDAETDVLGFAIAGDERFLREHTARLANLPEQFRRLSESVTDHPVQVARVAQIRELAEDRFELLQTVIDAREKGFDSAREIVITGSGKTLMDQIRQLIAELEKEQIRLKGVRSQEQDHRLFKVLSANLAAVCIGTVLTIAAWGFVDRELQRRRQAEATALSERQNLWVTLTSIGDGVIVADASGQIKLANPVAKQLMGDPLEVEGRFLPEIFSLIDAHTREPIANPFNQVLTEGTFPRRTGDTLLRRSDFSEIPIEENAAPIRDTMGRITGVVFVFRDCSERLRLEKEKNERERRFRRVFETPLIGIAIGTSEGSLLEANNAFLDLIGYRFGEFDNTKLSWSGVPVNQTPLDRASWDELREKGVCGPIEKTYSRNDGTRVPVLISAARLMNELDQIVVFITDLTQSKKTEAALRESEARFRVLSECMPQKVWTARPDGTLDYVNQMLLEYTGLTAEQMTDKDWRELVHPDDVAHHLKKWSQSLKSGNMFEIEERFLKHTGEYRWHLSRALPLYRPDGQIAMWVGTHTDIHDHKCAEEALREDHIRKDQFLALLAHELRNPLAPLSNAIQVFSAAYKDPNIAADLLDIMRRQLRQMTRLIDDLLDLSRITTGRMRLRCEKISVASAVAAAVEGVQPIIAERRHQLTAKVPQEEIWIEADPTRLAQILTNLLHNAAKYTDPEGQLWLTVERAGNEAIFRVRDNGSGIAKEMLNKIFDVFMQVEWTLDRANGGLGIGLTLVRTLVQMHGGTVTAASEGVGRGSEFTVRLPIKEELQQPPRETTAAPPEPTTPLPKLRILVVDDVQASAKTLAMMLQALEQDVETTFDGMSAISLATEQNFDLIFLDIAMPLMDGLEVARRLRAIPKLRTTRLVALTGFGQNEDRTQSMKAGFDEHLTKPVSMDLLTDVIRGGVPSQNGD
ncbi:PAS domain S-box protein [Schlesneria sp.]|uniref:PAS domain S-box protein n=1 Tax=Schlesneria sp. TaxID=2762018 RepID=UPI002EF92A8E